MKGRGPQTSRTRQAATAVFYEQLASERRVVRMSRGRPVARFERKPGAGWAESLDCLTYGLAAKAALALNAAAFTQRADELRSAVPLAPPPSIVRSKPMERRALSVTRRASAR